jgi:hypothetical protein
MALYLLLFEQMSMRVLVSLLFSAWLLGAQPLTTEASRNDTPITPAERLKWVAVSTIGPTSLIGGVFGAGFGTLINSPSEYGTHWQGFGQRYGMRLTGIATSNVIEAGAGAMWGEDPRYPRASDGAFGRRLGHAVRMTFLAPNESGRTRPAYARYLGITSNDFLSNTWRADSEATGRDASVRVAIGFLGRMGSNVFAEFWPDVGHRLFRTKKHPKP